jgi:hypothetical protein
MSPGRLEGAWQPHCARLVVAGGRRSEGRFRVPASKRPPESRATERAPRDRLPSEDMTGVHGGSLGGGEF